jgi:heme-based aerotactic transducer
MTDYAQEFGRGGLNPQVDPDALLEDIGLDAAAIEQRKAFVGFDDADAQRLSGLEAAFADRADRVADDFYENLMQYEDTAAVFDRSPKGVDELKRTQSAYFATLAAGEYDRSYFRDRARIGKLHDLLDLPMHRYLGQYGVYYGHVLEVLGDRLQRNLLDSLRAELDVAAGDGGVASAGGDATTGDLPDAHVEPGESTEHDADPDAGAAVGRGDDAGSVEAASIDTATLEDIVEREVEAGMDELLSVLRVINLDTQVVADTYTESYHQRLESEIEKRERESEERERLQAQVGADVEAPLERLLSSSEGVAESAGAVSEVTDEQTRQIDRITGEVSDLSATVEEVAATASEVETTSQRARSVAEQGRTEADEAVGVMDDVEDAVEDVADDVDSLQSRIGEIDAVVDVIDDIADQTNMLALNASIEAARAGEAGDGFAVVADEVKSLAEESQTQATRIEGMVDDIQTDADETVANLEATTERVSEGIGRVERAMASLDEIVDSVTEASQGVAEVSAATDEQAASAEEIASLLDDLVEQAERVAAELDDVAAATRDQAATIDEINRTVDRLDT